MIRTGNRKQNDRPPLVLAGVIVLFGLFSGGINVMAQDETELSLEYTAEGADTCLACHDENGEVPVMDIFKTPHAVPGDARTPFAQHQCESCHGPGAEHGKRLRFNQERPPIPAFGDNALWSKQKQNGICLDCHQRDQRMHWDGGTHERQDVACADCHQVHVTEDPVTVARREAEVCSDCHRNVQVQSHQMSSHPMRFGDMACSDCHQPHGSLNTAMLKEPTLNDSCYSCHADKRGPFLWEHAPVADDCTNCHSPHGSNHPALLKQRPPLLCQSCHSRAGHPSIARTSDDLPGGRASAFLLGGSCLNCHSKVHGSNHPSGANLSR
ncbi:DmsE family decaheme c-type cytochrome [Marinobacter sp. TBZ242]|uniref:DmsE family decaheme c-type cytochrome n=1 Tax=Marinobacter azerbaijanicus TaxID=3050455 RepID=A0ABT7IAV4_9GAMM|nr:DmsE family decaheme c-type cytochrome [Marinobacter sp. TBZ242]MDL0431291.1 DmsE family decaheme c-type cytochrome [Marinobacter sp. TBZ242]